MQKFVEFKYFNKKREERDIHTLDEFNVFTLNIPEDAVGFNYIEANSLDEAKKQTLDQVDMFVLAHPNTVATTQDVRHYGLENTLRMEKFYADYDASEKEKTDGKPDLSDKTIDDAESIISNFARPDSSGQVMMDFIADGLEQAGCHRVIGSAAHGVGVDDRATILDMDTRMVISPPYTHKP